ncbi:MAG: NAD(P)-dependent oxidoreductase [Rhodospirillales bacterium]|jgi:3-hydroxyisobutyrate dehydrogenase|nr:NAD(P)-dependent oxidoreductase [Rhodospirillales bacterium]
MTDFDPTRHSIGWIGAGRMGYAMAERLAQAGCDIAVYNRTRSKAEPLADAGAVIVDAPAELAGRDIIFTMVAASADLLEVISGPQGVLSGSAGPPRIFIDCTSVSEEASAQARADVGRVGAAFLAAPVSGNAKVMKAGKLSIVASGPRETYDEVVGYLELLGRGASYVGEGELARFCKIGHNVFLGVVIQSLVEITVLAEKAGVPRHAFLDFINNSVLGSMFTRYKTPTLTNLDYTTTFTPPLLRKDMDLGLSVARKYGVPMPLAVTTREIIQTLINYGYEDTDFATLLELQAKASNLELVAEDVDVGTGLED